MATALAAATTMALASASATGLRGADASAGACPNPPTVDTVELTHYMGRWYEIADSAQFRATFEKGLQCTTANYTLNADATVTVVNEGNVGSPTGKVSKAVGKAKQDKGGKLEVSFFGPFYGPYWITQLYGDAASEYSVSVVHSCTTGLFAQRAMWILSRTPQLPAAITLDSIYAKATAMGIDVAALKMAETVQTSDCVYGS